MSSTNGRSKNGGRRKSVPNEAPKWIREFFKDFLSSPAYRHNLKKRILVGDAQHLEILGHFFAFGNPRTQLVVDPPNPQDNSRAALTAPLRLLSKQDRLAWAELTRKVIAAQARQESQQGSPPDGS